MNAKRRAASAYGSPYGSTGSTYGLPGQSNEGGTPIKRPPSDTGKIPPIKPPPTHDDPPPVIRPAGDDLPLQPLTGSIGSAVMPLDSTGHQQTPEHEQTDKQAVVDWTHGPATRPKKPPKKDGNKDDNKSSPVDPFIKDLEAVARDLEVGLVDVASGRIDLLKQVGIQLEKDLKTLEAQIIKDIEALIPPPDFSGLWWAIAGVGALAIVMSSEKK